MATSWHNKDPGDTRDYRIDYTGLLAASDPIVSAEVAIPSDLTLVSPAVNTASEVVLRLAGGVIDNTYDVRCTVTTASGQIFPVRLALKIAERIVR